MQVIENPTGTGAGGRIEGVPCLERPEQPRQKEVRRMQELLNMDGLHVKRQRGKSGRCL